MKKQQKPLTTLILISSGFEEESTIICMKQMRSSGVEVKLVGLTAGLLVGACGLAIRPDITLAGLEPQKGCRLIVVPGCTQSTRSLLADPRVHELFAATVSVGGRVAVMSTAEATFVEAGLLDFLADASVIVQGGQHTAAFINGLIRLKAK
jgi:putative intracellular protease/amidase